MSDYLSRLAARSVAPDRSVQPRAASWFEPVGQAGQPSPAPGPTDQRPLDLAAGELEAVSPPATTSAGSPPAGTREAAPRSGGTPVRASSPSPLDTGGTLVPPPDYPTTPGSPERDGPRAPVAATAPASPAGPPPAGSPPAPTTLPVTTTPARADGERHGRAVAEADRSGEGELGGAERIEVWMEAVGGPDGRITGAPAAAPGGSERSLPRRSRLAAEPETRTAAGPWPSRLPAPWSLPTASRVPLGTPQGDGGTPAETPSIHVTIGRVEVRATPAAAARPGRRQAPGAIALDEYLRQQDERRT
jgi:hypothetical protein